MLTLGYGSPLYDPGTGVSVSGATALTNLAGLIDGRPGTQDSFEWGAGSEVALLVTFDRLVRPGVAMLVNATGLPPGLDVTVGLRRPSDGSPTYEPVSTELYRDPSGDVHALARWPADLDEVEAVEFKIDGTGAMSADDPFQIGELFFAGALRGELQHEIQDHVISRVAREFSPTGQPLVTAARSGRTILLSLAPDQFSVVYGDVQDALEAIAEDPRVVVVADDATEAAARRLSFFGLADPLPTRRFRGGPLFEPQLRVERVR